MFLTAISVIRSAWPFIRETFFQGRTAKQIIKTNKLVLFLTLSLSFSIYLNYLSIGKLIRLKISPLQATDSAKMNDAVKKNKKESAPVSVSPKASESTASAIEPPKQTTPSQIEALSKQQTLNNDILRRLKKLEDER